MGGCEGGRGGEGGVKGDAEYQRRERSTDEGARKKDEKRPLRREKAGQNNGIVTRLWMGASMKPMVCKTPRESA